MRSKLRQNVIETMEQRVLLSASQLSETVVSSTLAASISDHSAAKGKVVVNVANNSGTLQKEKVFINVVATTAESLDPQASSTIRLAAKKFSVSLADAANKSFTVPVNIKKGQLADGNYTLYAIVADPATLSQSPAGPTFAVAAPFIQLSETETLLKLPATATPALKVNALDKVTITNSGTDTSSDPLTINIYASTDGTVAGGTVIGTIPARKYSIKAGKSITVPVKIGTLPALADGTYKVIAAVTQQNSTVTLTDATTAPTITIAATNGGGGGGGGGTAGGYTDKITSATPKYDADQFQGFLQHITELDLNMEIDNTGAAVSGTHQLKLFTSTTATFDATTATQVGAISLPLDVAGTNGKRTFAANFGIAEDPSQEDGAEHDYFIFVQITDPNGVVTMASFPAKISFYGSIV